MQGVWRVSTRDMSREDWLSERRKTIGGSDAAGIVGLSKWASPYSVWAEKTGRVPEKEDTEAMRQGRDLEEYVAQRWAKETGRKVRRVNAILHNPNYPFAHADVDRMVVGANEGLECKTTFSLDLKKFHNIEFPVQYYAQCVHYLAVTNAERWHLAVLVFGKGFFTYTLERNQDEIDALMRAEEDFRQLVASDTPPEIDGSEASAAALQAVFPVSSPTTAAIFGRDSILKEYFDLRKARGQLEERMTEIENTIKSDMGEADSGECGSYRISWKSQTRSTFQPKDFQLAHPEIDLKPYYKTTSLRPFKVTEAS